MEVLKLFQALGCGVAGEGVQSRVLHDSVFFFHLDEKLQAGDGVLEKEICFILFSNLAHDSLREVAQELTDLVVRSTEKVGQDRDYVVEIGGVEF